MKSLIDFLLSILHVFQFWIVIDQYERGVVLRLGRYNRSIGPGLHWLRPVVEEALTCNVVPTTTSLGTQSVHTLDDIPVNFQCSILWRISSPKKMLLEVEDPNDVLVDAATAQIANGIASRTWDQVRSPDFAEQMQSLIEADAKGWGVNILRVYVDDCAKGRSVRLWGIND